MDRFSPCGGCGEPVYLAGEHPICPFCGEYVFDDDADNEDADNIDYHHLMMNDINEKRMNKINEEYISKMINAKENG